MHITALCDHHDMSMCVSTLTTKKIAHRHGSSSVSCTYTCTVRYASINAMLSDCDVGVSRIINTLLLFALLLCLLQ